MPSSAEVAVGGIDDDARQDRDLQWLLKGGPNRIHDIASSQRPSVVGAKSDTIGTGYQRCEPNMKIRTAGRAKRIGLTTIEQLIDRALKSGSSYFVIVHVDWKHRVEHNASYALRVSCQ